MTSGPHSQPQSQKSPPPETTYCVVGIKAYGSREVLETGLSRKQAFEVWHTAIDSGTFQTVSVEREEGEPED